MTYGDKLPSTHAQGYVFSLCGAKGDHRLQFAAPVDSAALIKDDISGAGKDGVTEVGIFFMPGACKIGVYVHVEGSICSRTEKETLILCGKEVATNPLHRLFMEKCRVDGETRAVVNCHTDIGMGHLGQVIKLAYHGAVVPGLRPSVAAMIWVQHCNCRGGLGMTGLEAEILKDRLDQGRLLKG